MGPGQDPERPRRAVPAVPCVQTLPQLLQPALETRANGACGHALRTGDVRRREVAEVTQQHGRPVGLGELQDLLDDEALAVDLADQTGLLGEIARPRVGLTACMIAFPLRAVSFAKSLHADLQAELRIEMKALEDKKLRVLELQVRLESETIALKEKAAELEDMKDRLEDEQKTQTGSRNVSIN